MSVIDHFAVFDPAELKSRQAFNQERVPPFGFGGL
jgi:hypothetical protein